MHAQDANTLKKDNDLNYCLHLTAHRLAAVQSQMSADVAFLSQELHVMDYSLIVGVRRGRFAVNPDEGADASGGGGGAAGGGGGSGGVGCSSVGSTLGVSSYSFSSFSAPSSPPALSAPLHFRPATPASAASAAPFSPHGELSPPLLPQPPSSSSCSDSASQPPPAPPQLSGPQLSGPSTGRITPSGRASLSSGMCGGSLGSLGFVGTASPITSSHVLPALGSGVASSFSSVGSGVGAGAGGGLGAGGLSVGGVRRESARDSSCGGGMRERRDSSRDSGIAVQLGASPQYASPNELPEAAAAAGGVRAEQQQQQQQAEQQQSPTMAPEFGTVAPLLASDANQQQQPASHRQQQQQPASHHQPAVRVTEQSTQRNVAPRGVELASIVEGPQSYHLGIIDILQVWSVRKRLERFAKIWLRCKPGAGISATPPLDYAQRFTERVVCDIFDAPYDSPPPT